MHSWSHEIGAFSVHSNVVMLELSNLLLPLNGGKDFHRAKKGGYYRKSNGRGYYRKSNGRYTNYKTFLNSSVYIALVPLSNHRIYVLILF